MQKTGEQRRCSPVFCASLRSMTIYPVFLQLSLYFYPPSLAWPARKCYTILKENKKCGSHGGGGAELTWGPLRLSKEDHTAAVDGREVSLTAREFAILALLMEHPKRAFSRAQIYESVWGEAFMGDDNTVNVHVSNLRAKLGKAGSGGEYIKTVWGIGFKMAEL